jgi:hypothetical protein
MHSAMFAYVPLVYCFLPETSGRTLEQIDYLFASKSMFVWNEEKEFEKRMAIFNQQVIGKEHAHADLSASEKPEVTYVTEV